MKCKNDCEAWFLKGDGACERCDRKRDDGGDDLEGTRPETGCPTPIWPDDEDGECSAGNPIAELEATDCSECPNVNCPHRLCDEGSIGEDDVEDDYGNVGERMYTVTVNVTKTVIGTVTVEVAADDESEAETRAIGEVNCMKDETIDCQFVPDEDGTDFEVGDADDVSEQDD